MINKNEEDEEMLQLDHNVGQWPMIPTSEPLLTGIIEKRRDFQGRDIWLNVSLDSADDRWNCYLAREALKLSK